MTISNDDKKGNDSMTSTSVAGRSEQYLEIKDYELQQGRNITYSDILSRQKVCVIGRMWPRSCLAVLKRLLGIR